MLQNLAPDCSLLMRRCVLRAPRPVLFKDTLLNAFVCALAGSKCTTIDTRFECGAVEISSTAMPAGAQAGRARRPDFSLFSAIAGTDAEVVVSGCEFRCAGAASSKLRTAAVWGGPTVNGVPATTHLILERCQMYGWGMWQLGGSCTAVRVSVTGPVEFPAFSCDSGRMLLLGCEVNGCNSAVQVCTKQAFALMLPCVTRRMGLDQ